MGEEGREVDVAKAWESILNPSSNTNEGIVPSTSQTKPESTWGNDEQGDQNAEDLLSHFAEEGSEEYAAKALSPLPEMDDNSCWHSLEFGINTFGKIGQRATMERSWYGINWLDKRTIILRSALLKNQGKLTELEQLQREAKAEINDLYPIKDKVINLEEEHAAWCLETKALRRLISNLQEEKAGLSQENEDLKTEVGKLKEELNKTNRVLIKVIDYIGRDDISGISQRTNQEVPKMVVDNVAQPIKKEPKREKPTKEIKNEDIGPSFSPSSDEESDQDDPTKFLEKRCCLYFEHGPVDQSNTWRSRRF